MTLKGARLLELLLSDFTWEGRQTFLENQSIDSLQQIAEEVPASLIRADGQHYPKDELIGIIQYGTRLNRILHTEVVLNKHTAIHRQLLAPISAEHPSIPDKVHSSRSKHMETTSLALQYLPSTSDALAMSPEVLAATSRPTQQSSQSHRRSNFPRLTSPTSSSYTPSPPLTKRRCFSPSPTPGALSSDNYEDFPVKQRKELLFSQLKSTAIQSNSSAVSVQTTFEANGKDSDPLTVKARSSEKFQRPRRATAGLGSYKQYRVEVDSDGEEYARSMSSGSESYGDDFVDEVCSEDELLQDEPYSDDALEVDDEDSSCNTSESDADSDEELHNYGRSRKITTSLSGATTSLPSDAARTTQSIARKRKRSTRRPVQAQPATHGFEQDLYEADSQGSFDDIMKRTIRQYVLPLASKNESIISAPLAALLQRPPTRLLHIIRSNTTQASREVLCQLNQGNIPSASLLSRLQEVKNMTLERSKGIYLHIGTPSEEDGGNDLKSSAVLVYIGSGLRDGSSPISAGLYKRCQEHSVCI